MDAIRKYVISIVAAAIICAIINCIVNKKSAAGGIIKFLCGLFMTITAISPWVGLRLPDELAFWEGFREEAQAAVSEGEAARAEMETAIIKEQLETYILEKAKSLELHLCVSVTLDDSFLPELVIIQGDASPYAKSKLNCYIRDNLGITEDRLKWT